MEVKVSFITSKRLHPKSNNLSVSKYTIEPLPSQSPNETTATNQYLLRFDDDIRSGEQSSQPAIEAKLFLSFFSLALGTKLDVTGLMINNVEASFALRDIGHPELEAVLDTLPDLVDLLNKFHGLDLPIARQFLRACGVYRTAINLIGQNNTLSYFLFTIAIECLSNVLGEGQGTCDKFIDFILKYLPDKSDFNSEDEWRELLKEIYYRHRSGFTHGGKEAPEASQLADRLNRIYVRNIIDGKEVRTPSLRWYQYAVRNTLLGFLTSSNQQVTRDNFKEISLEYGQVRLRAKRDLEANTIVTEDDVQLD